MGFEARLVRLERSWKKSYFPYILDRCPVISFVSWALKRALYGLKEAGKTYFPYILEGFSVISLRFSLVFHRENSIFFTFWTDFLPFHLGFPCFVLGKTFFFLRFGQISCHFLRFLGFEARLVRLERSWEKPYFPYILDRYPLGFRWFFIGKTLFSLHFGRVSCHFT